MITVVSGLPRSGTSLMMQMLDAGGLPVLVDERRGADADNPRGYFEFEKVKSLKKDNSWLSLAEGKAVKIVSLLLYDLPTGFDYQVIFMQRDLDEVLRSQETMLARQGADPGNNRAAMRGHFEKHLTHLNQWLEKRERLKVHFCDYRRLVEQPVETAGQIANFLQMKIDQAAMASVVDRNLYRQRSES